jgi:hypothetical protein
MPVSLTYTTHKSLGANMGHSTTIAGVHSYTLTCKELKSKERKDERRKKWIG